MLSIQHECQLDIFKECLFFFAGFAKLARPGERDHRIGPKVDGGPKDRHQVGQGGQVKMEDAAEPPDGREQMYSIV